MNCWIGRSKMGYNFGKYHYQTQREAVKALLDECYDNRRPNCFNISREFDVVSDDGRAFTVIFKFDNNEILYKVLWVDETPKTPYQCAPNSNKYKLYATNFVDTEGESFETNKEVFAFLKKHQGQKFALSVDGGERILTYYEDGLLWYGGKSKKIQ